MAVNVGTIESRLALDFSQFSRGLRRSAKEASSFEKSMKGTFSKMENVAKSGFSGLAKAAKVSLAAATATVAGLGIAVLKVGGDFEASMKGVQAVTGLAGNELNRLRDAALDMGRETQYSAREASNAIETLARNGIKGADALTAASEAALNLAAATGTDLATAADIATDAMSQFGFGADELTGVINQITQVTKESKFGIQDYFGALSQGGGAAGALGVEFEDFNAAIAATSSLFQSGRDAGTSFKTFITRLTADTGPAKDMVESLGLEFFDASGNMKSMAGIVRELNSAFEGLTEKQRISAAQTIFGTDAMRTALGLAKMTGSEFQGLADTIQTQGDAQADAKTRMEGFNGAMKELKSAAEDALIALGDSGLLAIAEKLVDWITKNVRAFGEWVRSSEQFQTMIQGLGTFITDTFMPGVEAAFSAVYDFFANDFVPVVRKGINMVADLWETEKGDIKTKAVNVMTEVGKAAAKALMDSMKSAMLNSGQNILEYIPGLGDIARRRIKGGGIFESILGGLNDAIIGNAAKNQAADGARFNGPKAGFLAMLHGQEIVIPDNPGQNPYRELARILGDDVPQFAAGGMTGGSGANRPDWLADEVLSLHAHMVDQIIAKSNLVDLPFAGRGGLMGPGSGDMAAFANVNFTDDFAALDFEILATKAKIAEQAFGSLAGTVIDSQRGLIDSSEFEPLKNHLAEAKRTGALVVDSVEGVVSGVKSIESVSESAEKASQAQDANAAASAISAESVELLGFQAKKNAEMQEFLATATKRNADFFDLIQVKKEQGVGVSTGQTVDVQAASNLLFGLGFGSAGTGRGVLRQEGPQGQDQAIADLLSRAQRGEFLDIKQIDFGSIFGGSLSDNLIRSVVDEMVSKANRQGAGTGSGVDYFLQNQRFIENTVQELARLALGSEGLREAQRENALSFRENVTALDIFRERMGQATEAVNRQREATVRHVDMTNSAISGLAESARTAQGRGMGGASSAGNPLAAMIERGGGPTGVGNAININVEGSVVTEQELTNTLLNNLQRLSRGGIGLGVS